MPERLLRLLAGLGCYGLSVALMVKSALGASPWDVFHLGAARQLPWSLGTLMVLVSVVVLLAWVPLRQWPGVGTVANTLALGPLTDIAMAVLPDAVGLPTRVLYLTGGVVVCAFATALYVGAQLGPGPRDGLMTGLARRTGRSLQLVRTAIEGTVLLVGVLLGGVAGLGTLVFALAIGPLTQFFLRYPVREGACP
jgi:uncharacterized membrane protein YczE